MSKLKPATIPDPARTADDPTPHDKRWARSGGRLHAKTALCAGLTYGRILRAVSLGCVGARRSEDTTRMSMTLFLREALCVYAESAWAL